MVELTKKPVVVIFDIYSTLLAVDKQGNYSTLYQAKEAIEELKALGSVYVLAQASEDMQRNFFAANPGLATQRPVHDILVELYGEDLFDLVSSEIGAFADFLTGLNVLPYNVLTVTSQLLQLQTNPQFYRTVWFNHLSISEEDRRVNSEAIATFHPDFIIVSHYQLPSIVENSIKTDADHFASSGIEAKATAPSRKRYNFGLLFDLLGFKVLAKPSMRAILTDRPEFNCVPIYLKDDLTPYGAFGIKVMIIKLNPHLDINKNTAFEADQNRIDQFCQAHSIIVKDEVRQVLKITDRIFFYKKMVELFDRQTDDIKTKFKMPVSLGFDNDVEGNSAEARVASYEQQAQQAGLEYPVLVKVQEGNKNAYAHLFYCVHTSAGMREALEFAGFANKKVLVQAYVPHKEQVYKIYAIDKWFKTEIRCSVPDSLMRSSEVVQFDHHNKFKPEDYKEFDKTDNRLDMPMTERLI